MRVLEFKSISREDGCIYYMKRYTAIVVLEIPAQTVTFPLSFSIETGPLGNKTIDIDDLPADLNYPIFPVVKSLKEFIQNLSTQGNLP